MTIKRCRGDENPLAGHTFTFVDPDGDERCECEKWLEPGYYEWDDHLKSVRRSSVAEPKETM